MLIIFCFAEIRPLLPYAEYTINYEYISKVLCINKDEPTPTCNGKCYLKQQLKKLKKLKKKTKEHEPLNKKESLKYYVNATFQKQ